MPYHSNPLSNPNFHFLSPLSLPFLFSAQIIKSTVNVIDYSVEVGGPPAAADGFNVAVCRASGSLSGAAGVDSNFSSFSPFRTFSISSFVSVSYSINALVSNSNSFRLSCRIFSARARASSTSRRTSASISCLVSEERLS